MRTFPDIDATLTDASLYRDAEAMKALLGRIAVTATRPWRIMEVCGGQTFTLSRYRIEELLPAGIEMIHGPGCPVCVTPATTVDTAISLALRDDVIMCSFGDMLRVPGTDGSLLRAKASGGDVRLLYSPLETLRIARDNPQRQVVFLAIGFETTAPVYAMLIRAAVNAGVRNLTLLTSLFTVPAAIRTVVNDPASRVDAILAAGHVCAVTGLSDYHSLARELNMPIVVTGFEPVDMLFGILRAVEMKEKSVVSVSNAYGRVVSEQGSPKAMEAVRHVFEPCDSRWRGMGIVPRGGMKIRQEYEQFDALRRFNICPSLSPEDSPCIAPLIMKGLSAPSLCPAFGRECTPDNPVGAPMVSSEGVCAAHYRYLK